MEAVAAAVAAALADSGSGSSAAAAATVADAAAASVVVAAAAAAAAVAPSAPAIAPDRQEDTNGASAIGGVVLFGSIPALLCGRRRRVGPWSPVLGLRCLLFAARQTPNPRDHRCYAFNRRYQLPKLDSSSKAKEDPGPLIVFFIQIPLAELKILLFGGGTRNRPMNCKLDFTCFYFGSIYFAVSMGPKQSRQCIDSSSYWIRQARHTHSMKEKSKETEENKSQTKTRKCRAP